MTIKSMTGFARAEGAFAAMRWAWEIRAVNGRNLDLRLRLPPGFDALEPRVREIATAKFQRGSIQIGLNIKREEGVTAIRLNEQVLAQVLVAATRVREMTGAPPVSVEGLLNIKGVLEVVEGSDTEVEGEQRMAALIASFQDAAVGVVSARVAEGQRLQKVLLEQVGEIARLTQAIEINPSRSVDAIKRRIAEQVARLIETSSTLDPVRLHQEAVLVASKADVEEELKRLAVHVAAARDLLNDENGVGRKLDFLAQEFNREANTVCSKAGDSSVTSLGLSMKTVIEQFREQVQNIE